MAMVGGPSLQLQLAGMPAAKSIPLSPTPSTIVSQPIKPIIGR